MRRLLVLLFLFLASCAEPPQAPEPPFAVLCVSDDTLKFGYDFSITVTGNTSDTTTLRAFIGQLELTIDSINQQQLYFTVPWNAESGYLRLYRNDQPAEGEHYLIIRLPDDHFLFNNSIVEATVKLTLPMRTVIRKMNGDTIHFTRSSKEVFATIGTFLPPSFGDSVRFNWRSMTDSTRIVLAFRDHRSEHKVSGWIKLVKETRSAGQSRYDTISVRVEEASWQEDEKEYVVLAEGVQLFKVVKELLWSTRYHDTGNGPWTEQLIALDPAIASSTVEIRFKHRK